MFIKYPKIHTLGKDEVEGILSGTCFVLEKIDGANASVWIEDGKMMFGSRNVLLQGDKTSGFRGFIPHVISHEGINSLFEKNPNLRLYGEWLVKHSITYNEDYYNNFYVFDILGEDGVFKSTEEVSTICAEYGIKMPHVFARLQDPDVGAIKQFVGKTELGDHGEGVVIRNDDFINQYGDRVLAKMVTERFRESHALAFGGNCKHSDSYWEIYVVNKYATRARVEKVVNKIKDEQGRELELSDTPMVTGICYHDLISEECWEISKKVPIIDFKKLKNLATRKFVDIFKESILQQEL